MHQKKIYDDFINRKKLGKKSFALLLDPDFISESHLISIFSHTQTHSFHYIFIGGSLVSDYNFDEKISLIKRFTDLPVIIFPGNSMHISAEADGILLLSLISGRNPEFLIGQHVIAAPKLKQSGLELLSTGYLLVDGGKQTTVSYISNTTPLPNNKPDIALCTALAGEMLGLKIIYLDAGSGAESPVSASIIKAISNQITIPLIVGGGIDTIEKAEKTLSAGADILVIGNKIEENPYFVSEIAKLVNDFNEKAVSNNEFEKK
jgi:phosphoglycerol geranylgeranyltransferase